MFGCFGRRKKKNKDAAKSGDKGKAPEPKPAPRNDDSANKVVEKPAATQQQVVTPQIIVESHPQQNETDASAAEVTETITVTRSQSLHHAPPKPGNIKKAATMSRYDFLKKQDNINYADRWASLKQRYLANKTENRSVVADSDGPDLRSANGQPRSPLRAAVKSLPRQFSPTSAGPASPVKFSDWFYDRQTKETEARQEFHEREERMRKIIEGPSQEDLNEAAVKIQAGYKGYKTRKEMKARKETNDDAPPAEGTVEAASAEKQQDEEPSEQPAAEAKEDGAPEDIDLNDPELAQAATKIQAGFKGYQTRKKLKDEMGQQEKDQTADEAGSRF